jgi:phosphomannomutase/phosphoglucomutase
MFFADRYFGFDDALYASLRLLEIMAETGKSLSQLLEGIPETYVTPEIRIPCPDEVKFQLVEAFKEKIRGKYEFVDIDGVRLKFPDGWGLIRASNTQPALVLRFEAQTEERLKEIRSLVENLLEETKRELG